MNSPETKKIKRLLLILLSLIAIGTFGFMIIERYSFLDSLFFTIISITTVGYSTLSALSEVGKIFVIILLISSFITLGFIIESLTQYVTSGDFKRVINLRKTKKIMQSINNHIIVCGYGSVGSHAITELLNNNKKIVLIEKNAELDTYAIREQGIIVIKGDATKEEILREARIDKAEAIITTLNSDADNLFVVITAKEMNPRIKIISRAVEDSTDRKLKMAGADYVILPDSVGGARMAKLAIEPNVIEFLENILAKSGISVQLVEINCEEIKIDLQEKTIQDLNVRKLSGANIIGFKTSSGNYIFNPSADTKLENGSKLFVLGTPEQVENFKNLILK